MAISLIPPEFRGERKTTPLSRIIPIVLFVYLFLALTGGGLFLFLNYRVSEAKVLREGQLAQIEKLKENESARVALKDRLSAIFGLSREKLGFREVFDSIVDIVTGNPELQLVEISADQQRIRLAIRGTDTFVVEEFLDTVERGIRGITFESLNLEPDGRYTTSLIIPL